jgi:type VI secretion system protein ImpH
MIPVNDRWYDLAREIEYKPYSYDMTQLVKIIEDVFGEIFFEVDPSLAFPPSDVSFVKIDKRQVTVRLSMMNILGASSPLPIWFSDYVCRGGAGAEVLRDFLSILQNRLHAMWVRAHLKYNLWSDNANTAKWIFEKMSARRLEQFENGDLFLLGAFSRRVKSVDGLKQIIKSVWKDIPVTIIENIGRWTSIQNRYPLGHNIRLGVGAVIGSKVYDRTAKFRISLGPLDIDTYKSFLPDGHNYQLLKNMICLYIDEPLICEVEIICRRCHFNPAQIGKSGLGRMVILGNGGDDIHRYRTEFCC